MFIWADVAIMIIFVINKSADFFFFALIYHLNHWNVNKAQGDLLKLIFFLSITQRVKVFMYAQKKQFGGFFCFKNDLNYWLIIKLVPI